MVDPTPAWDQPSSGWMPGLDLAQVALRQLHDRPATMRALRLEDAADMVAEIDPVDDAAEEPGRGVGQDRRAVVGRRPPAAGELVDLVARLAAEELRQAAL